MLGLKLREDAECRRCGGDLAETTDWEWSWKPAPPIVCLRCVALAADEQTHAKSPYRAGLIHQVNKQQRPKIRKRTRKRG